MTGCLNGWTLLSAQTPYAAAQDGLFPAAFARRERGVPTVGVTVALASLLTVYNCMSGSAKVFEILAAVAAAFSTCLIVGAGFAAVYQGVLFLFVGVMVYAVLAARRQRTA